MLKIVKTLAVAKENYALLRKSYLPGSIISALLLFTFHVKVIIQKHIQKNNIQDKNPN